MFTAMNRGSWADGFSGPRFWSVFSGPSFEPFVGHIKGLESVITWSTIVGLRNLIKHGQPLKWAHIQ